MSNDPERDSPESDRRDRKQTKLLGETEPPVEASGKCETPDNIDRFVIRGTLGEGAFGIVYRAYDARLNRNVALKVAGKKLLFSNMSVEKLLEEARASSSLQHPKIVRVYEFGFDSDRPFIVQELIDGVNLTAWMADKNSFGLIGQVISDVAEAVGYAHQNGVVHLDLKPSNILVDAEGMPHVADFGLAIHESQQDDRDDVSGTPAYMSPEQVRRESRRIDGRADIWAIGVIMYELLTGRRPFEAKTRNDLDRRICSNDPRPPRQRNPKVPWELERICLMMF